MFGNDRTLQVTSKPNGADVLIQKLVALSPTIDLIVAAALGGYSLIAIYIDKVKIVGLMCIVLSSIFACLGIFAVIRDMKFLKLIEQNSNPDVLRAMKPQQFEKYLTALFSLDGYRVYSATNELHRQDDADLIAKRKKETVLIQWNHWDEDVIGVKQIQSLHKAASILQADRCIALTFGEFAPEASEWGARKGVILMNMDDVITMACSFTESTPGAIREIA